MSKQSEAKEKQGWTEKPTKICASCAHFSCESITVQHAFGSYSKDKNLRCNLGGFKTGKTSSCNEWHAELNTKD